MRNLKLIALAALSLIILSMNVTAQKGHSGWSGNPSEMVTAELAQTVLPTPEKSAPAPAENELITATTYAFAVLAGVALEDMSSGTTQLVGPAIDDNNSTLQNIGFTFRFDGVNHTTFGVNTNGFISLGIAPTGTSFTNGIATTANQPKIMPFWDDLCTGSTGQVHFKTIGSPGSRKLIVEWQNMKITRNATCVAPVGNGTFQLWLFEGTGVIQFAYGAGTPATVADGGYSVGIQAASVTNFASVTTNGATVSYVTANNAQLDAIASGTSYTFSPNVPAAATGLNFTAVTQTSMSVNWTDNASSESGYTVSRSTDGTNYTIVASPAANSNTYADSGLVPGTTYFYRINAVSEGASSPNLDGSQITNPAGNVSSMTSGLWSAPATWAGGVVPAAGDNVTIIDGTTVTIDTAAVALSVKVGNDAPLAEGKGAVPEGLNAILQFDQAVAQSLTVGGNVSIGAGDTFRSALTGTVTTHNLSVGGNLTNNGTLDFSTNGDTAGAGITFTGASSNTFGGSGATTDIRTITVNKGTSNVNTIELLSSNFTVAGSTTDTANSGYLTLTNGTFRISGSFTGTHRTFSSAAYTIPATAGFWLSNTNYTVAAQTGNATVNGLLRVSLGTYNVGTAVDNSVAFGIGSRIHVEGGAINTAGRFGVGVAATTAINYTQTGGNITTCMVGSTSTTLACWDLGSSAAVGVVYSITGGTVVVQQASTAVSGPRDYRLQSGPTGTGTTVVTGGLVKFGNASTTGVQAFDGAGVFGAFELDSTSGANTFTMLAPVTWNNVTRNITIDAGTTMSIGSAVFLFNGVNFVNEGTFTANGAAANFVPFDAAGNVVVSGAGTFTGITTAIGMQAATITFNQTNQWRVRAFRVFTGNVVNANKITLGNNDATVNVVQFGNTTTPTLAGTLDAAPTFELGAGGQTISYLRTGNIRTTGPEVNPARSLVAMTYDNNDPATDELNIAGGNLNVGTLTLTNGEIKTGANQLVHTGTVTRTLGLVNGTLKRIFAATGTYTYHVGSGAYSPVIANVTTLTVPLSELSVTSNDAVMPGLLPASAAGQYWALTETGDLTANLTFTYNDADINGDENGYLLWQGTPPVQVPGAVMTPATNTGATTGVTAFNGNWGIGTALAPSGPADLGGRVLTSDGRGIRNVRVTVSGGMLPAPITIQTGQMGTYNFEDLPSGQTYTVTVVGSRFTFTPNSHIVVLAADVTNEDFFADPGLGVRPAQK